MLLKLCLNFITAIYAGQLENLVTGNEIRIQEQTNILRVAQ